ncbi:MAG: GNAT family N-acetyltransferase [Armatimonadetes bacterium]|nr:GNAT family N-acetyltransferase [Armatimonadota bacterium]
MTSPLNEPDLVLRPYDPERDREAVRRIWREVGWLDKEDPPADEYIECGRALVAELNGEAECLVLSAPGTVRYLNDDLPFAAVTGVTTSRIARKLGLARRLTARLLAMDAAEGAQVAGLGMFEQGFYNRLGFGTGGYEIFVKFDPARLNVRRGFRVPRRLTVEDAEAMHVARLSRRIGHGGCNLTPTALTRAEMREEKTFGLGYFDGPGGALSHAFWAEPKEVESGPYEILWLTYRTYDEFLELMALLKSLGDQVRLITMREPPGIQMQDLLDQPFKLQQVTRRSPFECAAHAEAYWQMRILDLPGCIARTPLPGADLRFNLRLHDPIETSLEEWKGWRGVAGEYTVSLGAESSAERGMDNSLPTLEASVGAFTRMWIGARPATGLFVTDDLSGPDDLLSSLDDAFRLPDPKPDWDY